MATATPVLWTYKKHDDGRADIKLRFTDENRSVYLSLGIAVRENQWNPRLQRVRKNHRDADEINSLIAAKLAAAESAKIALLADGHRPSAQALRDSVAPGRKKTSAPCFLAYVDSFLDSLELTGKVARVDRERVVVGKLREHFGEPLPFDAITPEALRSFEGYLIGTKGNKASTVHANVGTIKVHYRRAIREGLISRERDPFMAYSPPRVKRTERTKLSVEQLGELASLDLGPRGTGASLACVVRDVFLFSVFAAGIRFGDAARLRCADLTADGDGLRIAYTAGKTDKRPEFKLPVPAVQVAKPFLVQADGTAKEAHDFLFPILEGRRGEPFDTLDERGQHAAVKARTAVFNKQLKKLAEMAQIKASLTTHAARHTFADLARKKGWSIHTISEALDHSNLTITERYVAVSDRSALETGLADLFPGLD